jgi:flagellar basal body-associated protein FliL
MAEGEAVEAAPAAPEPKKSKKKLIIMIVVFGLIGYVVATKTVLKPPPPTPAQLAAAHAVAERELEIKCSKANGKVPPAPLDEKALIAAGGVAPAEGEAAATTTTTLPGMEKEEPAGPVLLLDAVTVNLADGRFLKMAVGFQMPAGTLIDEVEAEHPATAALSYLIEQMRLKTSKNLGPKDLGHIREDLGYNVCVSPELNAEGKISTIYFTEFVAD